MFRTNEPHMKSHRLLASAALFRQLHENKKDVYDVLSQFIRATINIDSKWNFNVTDCTISLEKNFGFKIPDAVIKTCLNKRLKNNGELILSNGSYNITESFSKVPLLSSDYETIQSEQSSIIDELVSYAEKIKEEKLIKKEIDDLASDFHNYFLGGLLSSHNHFVISEFIIANSNRPDFIRRLNSVEEGLILYTGICHSPSTASHEPWRNNFSIYLDTEILFFSQGFNGSLYKNIFDDFHSLVEELNSKTPRNVKIEMKFFPETKREVEEFFYAAERIVVDRRYPDPSKPAMINIINGCSTAGDVLERKAQFYDGLRKLKITEEVEHEYYNSPEYIVEGSGLLSLLKSEHPNLDYDKVPLILQYFTKINYLRKGKNNQGLEQASAIFISGKYAARILAFSKLIQKEPKQVPFATDLDYMTERLWFKLNKGFNDGTLPRGFDVIARAQIILSTEAGNKVSQDYKSLIEKVNRGELSHESAGHLLSELRSKITKPEDFNSENIEEVTSYLKHDFIEHSQRQKAILQLKADEGEKHKASLEKLNIEIIKKDAEIEKNRVLYAKQLRAKNIEQRNIHLTPLRKSTSRHYTILYSAIYLFSFLLSAAFILLIRNNNDTPTSMLSLAFGALPFLLAILKGRYFSKTLKKHVLVRYKNKAKSFFATPKQEQSPEKEAA